MKALFAYLQQHHKDVKTLGSIGPNDETGWGTAEAINAEAEKSGLKHTFKDFFQRGSDDFFPILTKLVAKNPDALILHSVPPPSMAVLLKQKHQLGYKGLILAPSHYEPKKLVEKAAVEAVEGLLGSTATPEGFPQAKPVAGDARGFRIVIAALLLAILLASVSIPVLLSWMQASRSSAQPTAVQAP